MPAVAKDLQFVLLNVMCFGGGALAGVGATHAYTPTPMWMVWIASAMLVLAALALATVFVTAWRVIRLMNARYREEDARRRTDAH
jgi:hypothetical protein